MGLEKYSKTNRSINLTPKETAPVNNGVAIVEDKAKEEQVESKEKSVEEKILDLQLQYCQRLFEKEIPSISPSQIFKRKTFEGILCRYSNVIPSIGMAYQVRTEKYTRENKENKKEFELVKREILENIKKRYKENPETWHLEVPSLIESTINKLPKGIRKEEKHEEILTEEQKKMKLERIGIFDCAFRIANGKGNSSKCKIKKGDWFVEIHIEPSEKDKIGGQKETNKESNISVSKALQIIAERINNDFPDSKAIVAHSWILDSKIAEEVGFKIVSKDKKISSRLDFWGQFVNKDGSINEKRANEFLKTGRPHHLTKLGYIPVKDFLEKYLPKNE